MDIDMDIDMDMDIGYEYGMINAAEKERNQSAEASPLQMLRASSMRCFPDINDYMS